MPASDTAKTKRPSTAARESALAVVEIGDEKTKYTVHRSLLVAHSEYFKKALSGPWKEAQGGIVTLDDVDPDTFNIFVDWMYTQRIPENDESWIGTREHGQHTFGQAQVAQIKAFILGDRIMSPAFHREVRDSLIGDLVAGAVYYEAVIHAFANLPAHDTILELMVDSHCHDFDEDQDNEDNGEIERRSKLPHVFLLRVMLRYGRLVKDSELARADLDPCNYHRHVSDEEKELCRAKKDKK